MASQITTRPPRRARGADGAAPTDAKPKDTSSESIKETLESIVIAFILAFVFRAYVVEAFVIPTGSMAPTLLGRNVRVYCAQCAYHFKSDPDDGTIKGGSLRMTVRAHCPMCHYPNDLKPKTRVYAGDRILVHKYIYSLMEPQRWDVVVFKNPREPMQNFIKRLAGLPEESLWIIEGNVYVKPILADDTAWEIARKTVDENVQRTVWQPIYYSIYVPLDNGRNRSPKIEWRVPWVAVGKHADQWQIERRRSYRFDGTGTGTIRFDFDRAARGGRAHWYAYNQQRLHDFHPEPITDVRLAASFQPQGAGLAIEMQTTARLEHVVTEDDHNPPAKTVALRIDASGAATVTSFDPETGRTATLREAQVNPFVAGQTTTVELWHVDQQVSVWIDGRRIDLLTHEYELNIDALRQRDALDGKRLYPQLGIEVSGSPVQLHRVEVDRDIFYSSTKPRQSDFGRGTLDKRSGPLHQGDPIHLQPDQFYCLGDNSPMSQDSRYWEAPDPWIKHRMLQESEFGWGVVPRQLMMGKAFFVYFPAALAWSDQSMPVIPNFGEMRFIH